MGKTYRHSQGSRSKFEQRKKQRDMKHYVEYEDTLPLVNPKGVNPGPKWSRAH